MKRYLRLIVLGMGASFLLSVTSPIGERLAVTNGVEGTIIHHELAIIQGTVRPWIRKVKVEGPNGTTQWPARGGYFTALVPLEEGKNRITLHGGGKESFTLRYQPREEGPRVRLVYLLAQDENEDHLFDAPEGGAPENRDASAAAARIALGARLLQTTTAEMMHRGGWGRKTFRLERDGEGEPIVHILHTNLTEKAARSMTGFQLWGHINGEIACDGDEGSCGELGGISNRGRDKVIVLMAFTHLDPKTGEVVAHTALGGGELALFGSASLHSWPTSVDEVPDAFMDSTRYKDISPRLHDDSHGRGTFGAAASTTLGAVLHELGHTLGLPHPGGEWVMQRGFDNINRAFLSVEIVGSRGGRRAVSPGEAPLWHPLHTLHLAHSPWLGGNGDFPPPVPVVEVKGGEVFVVGGAPLTYLAGWADNHYLSYQSWPEGGFENGTVPSEDYFTEGPYQSVALRSQNILGGGMERGWGIGFLTPPKKTPLGPLAVLWRTWGVDEAGETTARWEGVTGMGERIPPVVGGSAPDRNEVYCALLPVPAEGEGRVVVDATPDGIPMRTIANWEEGADKMEMSRPWIIAHRGASAAAPENTHSSLDLAWQLEADAAEVDIRLTRDGVIVLMHDSTVDRTTDGVGRVKELTLEELQGLDAGSWKGEEWEGERVPTLEDVLALHPAHGQRLVVEMKTGPEILPELQRVVEASGIDPSEILFTSFDFEVVKGTKRVLPSYEAIWLVASFDTSMIAQAIDHGIDGLDIHYSSINADSAACVLGAGLRLVSWTVNDVVEGIRLRLLGVEGFTTDHPQAMRDALFID